MNIKKKQLKDVIKQIVRESLNEHEYDSLLSEVSPPGKKAERMIHHVKTSLRKAHPDWSEDRIKGVAIATGWKARNAGSVEEGLINEISDSKISVLDDVVRAVMNRGVSDPAKLKILVSQLFQYEYGRPADSDAVDAAIERNKRIKGVDEASYKQVAPHSYTDAEEDKARTIQTDPEVNEVRDRSDYLDLTPKPIGKMSGKSDGDYVSPKHSYSSQLWNTAKKEFGSKTPPVPTKPVPPKPVDEVAYKVQGPSLKTFEDSPQFPEALNDPENA